MKIKSPEIREPLVCRDDLDIVLQEAAKEGLDVAGIHVKNAVLTEGFFSGSCFYQVIFENCRLLNCTFSKTRFIDVRFQGCDCSNTDFSEGYFHRCTVKSSKWLGANFYRSSWQQVTWQDCNFQFANFSQNHLLQLAAYGSDFSESYLTECKLKQIELVESRFLKTNFFKTSLKNIDFSQCQMEGIIISDTAEELRGATINPVQAVDLVKLFGVVVKY